MYSIGVDLGGTKIRTAIVSDSGSVLHSAELPTGATDGPDAVIERVLDSIRCAMAVLADRTDSTYQRKLIGIGVGSPGPLDPRTGVVLSPPNLPGWYRIPLRKHVESVFQLPTYLDNDANVAALAEWRFGAGQGADNMVYATVSTGIGAGLILDGKLFHGQSGSAGEIGHMIVDAKGPLCTCGNHGCLEAWSSGTAISNIATERYGRPLNAKEVEQLAKQGDAQAQDILEQAFSYLGLGLINVVNLFNPSVIVIGGGVAQVGAPLFERVRDIVLKQAIQGKSVQILPALLGKNAGVIGAAALPFISLGGGDGHDTRKSTHSLSYDPV